MTRLAFIPVARAGFSKTEELAVDRMADEYLGGGDATHVARYNGQLAVAFPVRKPRKGPRWRLVLVIRETDLERYISEDRPPDVEEFELEETTDEMLEAGVEVKAVLV